MTRSLQTADSVSGVSGTLAYMPPEILRGETADYRSDLWSLGVVLYEVTCGRLPFDGHTPFEISSAILREQPKPLGRRVYLTDDGGTSWTARNHGIRATFMPGKYPEFGQCVQKIAMHPGRPERLFLQNHWGIYRTDDCGTWKDIGVDVPSDFGFPLSCIYANPTASMSSLLSRISFDAR